MTTPSRRRRPLTDAAVRALKPGSKPRLVADPSMPGLFVRVLPSGVRSYVTVARKPGGGSPTWHTIARCDHVGVEEARAASRTAAARIKRDLPPREEPPPAPETFQAISDAWLKRHVEAKALRTSYEIKRALGKYVLPVWGTRAMDTIRRSDVAKLLDHVQDRHGARQADVVLSIASSIMHWHAARSDDFAIPLSRGMRRTSTAERARVRTLTDAEIAAVWRYAETAGGYGGLLQTALLSGQRVGKLTDMRWSDLDGNVWRIRTQRGEKGNGGPELHLPALAMSIIERQARFVSSDLVFNHAGGGPLHMGRCKKLMDSALKLEPFVVHDLRRSCRSMLTRIGIASEVAEAVLGHVRPGVESVYNRHQYIDEKRAALHELAALIERIVDPTTTSNVVAIKNSGIDGRGR